MVHSSVLYKSLILFLLVLFSFSQVQATVAFANIFTNNMILQRNSPVNIYGTASPGEPMTVTFGTQSVTGIANSSGSWAVTLSSLTSNAIGQSLAVQGPSNTVTYTNVVVGDVYLCSGQSNMDDVYLSECTPNGSTDAANANYPNIRMLHIADSIQQYPLADIPLNSWFTCTTANTSNVGNFSGLAFYIGRDLYQQENVPIGLIQSAFGGMPAESFLSQQALLSDPILYPAAVSFESGFTSSTTTPWPTGVYNGMIAPLTSFTLNGVFWDQGESNEGSPGILPAEEYAYLLPEVIKDWRMKWNSQLPFFIVQLQNIGNMEVTETSPTTLCTYWPGAYGTGPNYPIASVGIADVRWGQFNALKMPFTGMSVNFDMNGDPLDCNTTNSYHPKNKEDFAARLVPWAMDKIYNNSLPLSFTGPLYQSYTTVGSSIVIQFTFPNGNGASGFATSDGNPVTGFQIAPGGSDPDSTSWVFASATTVGSTVVVSSPSVPAPGMVRYAWGWDPVDPNGPVANLTDVNGYLASPFETVNYSDMMVLGPGSVTIQDLNLTPLTTNGTDFATVGYSQPMTETFTIANASDALASLSLTGLADGGTSLVRLTGPNSSEFSVVSQPLASALAVGGTTTFQVAFQPVSTGLAQAILQIPNNTPHKTPYTIYLQGTGKDDRTPTFTPTGTWYTSTSTMTPTPTNTLTPTVTPNIAVSMIDDFDENNLGNAATRTNLWGQPWGAFLGPSGNSTSINVSYFSPGAANTSTSVSIYGNLASGGYCNYLTYLKSGSAAYNAVAAGYTGIQFYIYGDVTGHTYRAQIMSASITTGDYLGQNVVVQADGQWHLIQIPFSTMTQAGWGTQTGLPPTGTDMTGVKFDVVSPTAGAYYFLLDQVSLYGPVPTSTYTPTISPTFTPTPSGTWFTSTYTITSTPTITFTPTASLTPTLSPTPAGTDNTVYNFEDGTVMGWSYVNNQAIATQNTGGIFYLGSHSLAVSLNVTAPATDSEFGAQPVTSVASNLTGKFVIAHLWVPSTFPTSSTADIYLKSGAAWGWQTGPTVTLTPGAWNTLTLNPAVPFNAAGTSDITNVQGIGVQIFASAAWAGTIYLDSVDILSGTPTPTTTPLNTATPPPTATPTITPTFATPTPTLTFTPSPTGTPTQTQSPTPTFTPIQNVDRPFPNPNNGSSPLFIYHNLTQPADRVSFKVYTLSFRKIYEDDSLPTGAGKFEYTLDWNKSGLSLSNGLYYFVIVEKRSSRETQTVLKELIIR